MTVTLSCIYLQNRVVNFIVKSDFLPLYVYLVEVWGRTCLLEEEDVVEEEEDSDEMEEAEVVGEDSDEVAEVVGEDTDEVEAEVVLTGSKTLVLQNMLSVRSLRYQSCFQMGLQHLVFVPVIYLGNTV